MYDSVLAEIKGENRLIIFSKSCIFSMFSHSFEKQFKTLIGRKFNKKFLSSAFLSTGVTEATFKLFRKQPFFILLLINNERGLPSILLLM